MLNASKTESMRSLELFAGASGLAIGMANAGFHHEAVVEWDHDACETIRENSKHYSTGDRPAIVIEGDVRTIDYADLTGNVCVVSGGPPCQPFSLGGKHGGFRDNRDMFPEAVRAVRETRPKAFIFENVKGLLRQSFASYFEYILLQLSYPSAVRRADESWTRHRERLERHHTAKKGRREYNVVFRLLNAADYGVPQRRERVFLVGFRADIDAQWNFPEASHSEDALISTKWIDGTYWDRHRVSARHRGAPSPRLGARLARLRCIDALDTKLPWRTVRDALIGLPDPSSRSAKSWCNHSLNPGARAYPGHTGSPLDEPAKTLKAGGHGVPGGENMILMPDSSVRYFTVREAARIQTFPDDYAFKGAWSEAMRQLGNAVPVKLAEVVAESVAQSIGKLR